ncbi:MAG: nucleoside phosphorylase [Sediminibacterium sp.]
MSPIASSELIINERGGVYHLNLRPEELAPTIITVGDPDRVASVSRYFDSIEFKQAHREFISHTGYVGKRRITVVSTGIGTDNIDIVLNELDALANIDLTTRLPREEHQTLQIIRIGTSGSLQADIPVDEFVASTHAIGIDNLLLYYLRETNTADQEILHAFIQHTHIDSIGIHPYIAPASISLLKNFVTGFHQGITITTPGFYGPQGRVLRLKTAHPTLVDTLIDFHYGNHRVTNFEMETSAIYGLGKLMGHSCLSLSAIVANRVVQEFSTQASETIDRLIRKTLQILSDREH